jgi:hypothetical protein
MSRSLELRSWGRFTVGNGAGVPNIPSLGGSGAHLSKASQTLLGSNGRVFPEPPGKMAKIYTHLQVLETLFSAADRTASLQVVLYSSTRKAWSKGVMAGNGK